MYDAEIVQNVIVWQRRLIEQRDYYAEGMGWLTTVLWSMSIAMIIIKCCRRHVEKQEYRHAIVELAVGEMEEE